MMSSWSNGWMRTAPVRVANSCAAISASVTPAPANSTSAPYPRVALTLGNAAPSGMKIVALVPSSEEASATPWAWFTALAATTPWARSSSDKRAIRTYAPRILKEPARCRFSHFRLTDVPAILLSHRDSSVGVTRATPCRSSRAAFRSLMSTTVSLDGDSIVPAQPVARRRRPAAERRAVATGTDPPDGGPPRCCLLYTSDAADDLTRVDLGG